jgi:hypothetical protein
MLNPQIDNAGQAIHDAAREGAEHADRIVHLSTEVSERAARAGAEIFQRNAETVQQALQSGAEIAARLTERSADQFGRVFGISGDEAHKAAQQSSDNIDAILHSGSVLAEITQGVSREWVNFARDRVEQNFTRFEKLMRCRNPQDFAAIQSELLRDNIESFLHTARRIAEKSMQAADEASKRTAEMVERVRAA